MRNTNRSPDVTTGAADTQRLFEELFGDDAEAVGEAILLMEEDLGIDLEEVDPIDAEPMEVDDAEFDRLLAVIDAFGGSPSPVSGGSEETGTPRGKSSLVDVSSDRRRVTPRDTRRRHIAYRRGGSNVLRPAAGLVRDACLPIPSRMHMDARSAPKDFAFDLTPYREWLVSHDADWVGDYLLLFALDSGPLVRVTSNDGGAVSEAAAALIVEFIGPSGHRHEVRLTPNEREMNVEMRNEDVSPADWQLSVAVEAVS